MRFRLLNFLKFLTKLCAQETYLKTVAYFLLKNGFRSSDGVSYGIVPIPLNSMFDFEIAAVNSSAYWTRSVVLYGLT